MPAGSRSTRLTLRTRKDQIIQILEETKEHADPTATVAPNGKHAMGFGEAREPATVSFCQTLGGEGGSSAVNRAEI
jgi:hypothetical protein